MGRTESLLVNGERIDVEILETERGRVKFQLDGRTFLVEREIDLPKSHERAASSVQRGKTKKQTGKPGEILSPIPGVIVEILVSEGEVVTAGQLICKLEAMKMQNRISTNVGGTIRKVYVQKGQEVGDGELIVEITI